VPCAISFLPQPNRLPSGRQFWYVLRTPRFDGQGGGGYVALRRLAMKRRIA